MVSYIAGSVRTQFQTMNYKILIFWPSAGSEVHSTTVVANMVATSHISGVQKPQEASSYHIRQHSRDHFSHPWKGDYYRYFKESQDHFPYLYAVVY